MNSTNIILDDMIESVYDLLHNTTKYASLYYTYYTLNLKGIKDFDYAFRTLEKKLYDDFYHLYLFVMMDYIIDFQNNDFTILSKTNGKSHKIKFLLDDGKTLNESIITTLMKCTGCDPEFIWNVVKLNVDHPKHMKKSHFFYLTIDELKYRYNYIEKEFGWINNSREFLTQTQKMIDTDNFRDNENYNGQGYKLDYICNGFAETDIMSGIVYMLLTTAKEDTKTTFVDTAWSIAHQEYLFLEMISDDDLLHTLLADVFNGNYKDIYEIAKLTDPRLGRYLYRSILIDESHAE